MPRRAKIIADMEFRTWDVFCHVVDNFGDVGVCWRLAADLAARGERVRLWIDDASALAWMAPHGAPGVRVVDWLDAPTAAEPGDVVVEAFGCNPPADFIARMAARARPPVWINLEYLSAETYVERYHGLSSPQANGLIKWFFYPGFSAATGGLIREPGLMQQRHAFDAAAWLEVHRIEPAAGRRVVSLFCYQQPALDALLDLLAPEPTLLLATAGHAAIQVQHMLGPALQRGQLKAVVLPLLSQLDYDHLLWASDLNFVRGEDSLVRAAWAAAPFVWQIYPQHDAVHHQKLRAFLARHLAGADAPLASQVGALWQAWNGARGAPPLALPTRTAAWLGQTRRWRDGLLEHDDLVTRLCRFVAETG